MADLPWSENWGRSYKITIGTREVNTEVFALIFSWPQYAAATFHKLWNMNKLSKTVIKILKRRKNFSLDKNCSGGTIASKLDVIKLHCSTKQ